MTPYSLFRFPILLGLLLAAMSSPTDSCWAQNPKKAKISAEQRESLLQLDTDLRAAFSKAAPTGLPEKNRKLPDASAKSFDWIKFQGLTPIYSQGQRGTCAALAAIAALEWNWQIRNGVKGKLLLSPQPIIDHERDSYGLSYGQVLDHLLLRGTTTLKLYPYVGDPQPPKKNIPTRYRLVGWGMVGPPGETPIASVKEALLEHGPLLAGVFATPNFQRYSGGVFSERYVKIPDDEVINHAVVIIGWDDSRGNKGCWHIQNSWGLDWGEQGGMWIEYGSNNVDHVTFWLKAQSSQYHLTKDAHKLLGDSAQPYYQWPYGKTVSLGKTKK